MTFGAWRNCGGKFDGLGDAFVGRGKYVDVLAAIFLGRCANVPTVDAVTGPGAADGRGFMDKHLSARWCKGRSIEIVGAVEMGLGRNMWVDAGQPEKIGCGCSLGNEVAPQTDGKIGVNAGQAGKEMTFPSVDSFFGGVSAMDVGKHKVVVKREGLHVAFDSVGTFIV